MTKASMTTASMTTASMTGTTQIHLADPFLDEALDKPDLLQVAVRETGPIVWLSRYGIWATCRECWVARRD